uniref:Caprin-1 dimerization domain-containing protein n=1 Tax=Trichobilharzia regenti TaxID=157069 RepID=A0AA85KIE7_TRIRE|nr:unnamed protein product [Trichobilharzia regenti]
MSTTTEMPEAETPGDLVRGFVSNLERRQRNLVKRKSKLDGYREKLQKGESLKEEQKKAVESYDVVVQNISFVQEVVNQAKDLISNMEAMSEKLMSQIEAEHERHTLTHLSVQLCLQRFLYSLDIPTVRSAVVKSSSESSLKLLDALRNLMTPPVVDNWPGCSSSALASAPEFLQARDDIKAIATNTYNFTSGRSIPVPLPSDLEEFRKKNTTFKDARNLCFRLLANPTVQQSLGLIEECEAVNMVDPIQPAAETPDTTGFTGPVDMSSAPQHEYTPNEPSHITPADEPVDQVIRPLNNTFNFIQASRVVHSQVPIEPPSGFDEMIPDNHVQTNTSVPCFNNHNFADNDVDHSVMPRLDQQYVLEIPEAEPRKTDTCERSPSSLPTAEIVRQASPYKPNIVAQDERDININGNKPISYADSVRKLGQVNQNLRQDITSTKKVDRAFEDGNREAEQFDQNNRGHSRGGFRGRITGESRGGRGGAPRRNAGQRGGSFGAHPGRGGAPRGMPTAFAQPTY